ncbi:hypothetical protein [Arthrobacter sp. PAMC25564]|uniref:hypothetical protein n=1 Tax=Arthrobacter sp. PAMC25564 TaxID=2565366 RepID=UPI001444AB32|nr:hypothetical protein [Arthrobacter sp. PAMC25564]
MTISITATPIERVHASPIADFGVMLRMGGGNYIYFTHELAAQWVEVLQTIATNETSY